MPRPPETEPRRGLIDVSEVAQLLGVQVRHVRRLVHERRIPYVKWGHLVRFDPDDVAAWIDTNRRPAGYARSLRLDRELQHRDVPRKVRRVREPLVISEQRGADAIGQHDIERVGDGHVVAVCPSVFEQHGELSAM